MQNFTTKTIREIAVAAPATTRIFEEYKIDFCCGGNRNFQDACYSAGVAPEIVTQKLNHIFSNQTLNADAPEETKSAAAMIDYILEKHHVFTRAEIARLSVLMEKVCRKHGASHLELIVLQKLFAHLSDDLTLHMKKEETVLFPYIKHLEMSAKNNLSSPRPPFGTIGNPVRMMMTEHDTAGDLLRKMREITNDYALTENACPSLRALYFGLEELEKDLHRHIHLENNVLFPRAIKIEEKVIFGY